MSAAASVNQKWKEGKGGKEEDAKETKSNELCLEDIGEGER